MVIKFFPSEIARLVLGYLKESKCLRAWEAFLTESYHLQEYYQIYQEEGEEYPTVVDGKSLLEILLEYRQLKDELRKNVENQSRQETASISNTEVFKTPRKSNETAFLNYKVNQKTRTQSTVTSLHYTQSREKCPEHPGSVLATPTREVTPGQSKRLQGVHSANLNFDNNNETNLRGIQRDEMSCRLSAETLRTPGRNISTTWAFKSTTPSRQKGQTDPARRKVNFFPRTPEAESLPSSNRIQCERSSAESSINNYPGSAIDNPHSTSGAKKTDEVLNSPRLLLESSEASTSGAQSSIINRSIVVRSSEVTAGEGNFTITTMKSSVTPQYECEPPPYNRAPDTNSPRIILSYDRSQIPSLSTPMKDRRSWTEDFSSPKRKGFIPRRRLVSESPVSKQIASNDPSLSLPDLGFSILEDFFNNQPLAQRIADNINKVLCSDESTKDPEFSNSNSFPSLQDIHGSEEIIKDALARTEADPMFEECISFLYSSRDLDEITTTQESSACAAEGNSLNCVSDSILAESSLTNSSPPVSSNSKSEVTDNKIESSTEIEGAKDGNNIIKIPLQSTEKMHIPDATDTTHDCDSIPNSSDACSIKSNVDSSVASESEVQNSQKSDNLNQELNPPNPVRTMDVLDSCMSIIQPDSEEMVIDSDGKTEPDSAVVDSAPEYMMEIEDKTIKQVPIGTPCQVETQMVVNQITDCSTITPTSVIQSPIVPMANIQVTSLQNSQNTNVTNNPTVQNTSSLQPIGNSSNTFQTSTLQPTTQYIILPPNPFNNWYCGSNWYCSSNTPNNVGMPIQNFPTILPSHAAVNAPLQSMPVVDLSPKMLDCSPTKAVYGESTVPVENVGNFVTIPANVPETVQKKTLTKKKQAKPLPKNNTSKGASSKVKKAKNKITNAKTKKKLRPLFKSPSKDILENIVNEEIGEFPVLSIPDPSPDKACSLSAMELFSNITENKSPQSPLLKEVLSRAKLLAARNSLINSKHVRTLEFNSRCPKQNARDKSKSPKLPIPVVSSIEERRSSPRLKNKTSCKSLCCSPLKVTEKCGFSKETTPEVNKIQPVKKACLGEANEQKSPQRSVSMAEEILVAMEQAVQTKALHNTSCSKDGTLKDELAANKLSNKVGKKIGAGLKDLKFKSHVKTGEVAMETSHYFPSTLTESDSDTDLLPLSSLLTNSTKELTKNSDNNVSKKSNKYNQVASTSKVKPTIGKNSDIETEKLSSPPDDNIKPKYNRKGKGKTRLNRNKKNSSAKDLKTLKNIVTKPIASKSPKKLNQKVDTKSAERTTNFSSGEHSDENQPDTSKLTRVSVKLTRLNTKEISQEPKSSISTNEKQADESTASGIQKGKQNTQKDLANTNVTADENAAPEIQMKKENLQKDLADTKITPDENVASGIQKGRQNTQKNVADTKVTCDENAAFGIQKRKQNTQKDLADTNITPDENAAPEIQMEKENMQKDLADTNVTLDENAASEIQKEKENTQKDLAYSKVALDENAASKIQKEMQNTLKYLKDPKVTLDECSMSEVFLPDKVVKILRKPGVGQQKKITETVKVVKENVAGSPSKSQSCLEISVPEKLKDTEEATCKTKSLSDKKACLDGVSSSTIPIGYASELIPPNNVLKSAEFAVEFDKDSHGKEKLKKEHSKIISIDKQKTPSRLQSNKLSEELKNSAEIHGEEAKKLSEIHSPSKCLQKYKKVKQSASELSDQVPFLKFISDEGLKNSEDNVSKSPSIITRETEKNSNKISPLPKANISLSTDACKTSPFPIKKILPPPKKRIRPVPVTSPSDGGFSPFSPFSSPAHAYSADLVVNSKVKVPTLMKDDVNVSQTNKSNSSQNSLKVPSGKPKAMAEFYKAALPERSNDLPISPGSISSSSCTVDSFLARKMLTGSCAKNANVKINFASEASEFLSVSESPKKVLSANNLKFMFSSDHSSLFSPAKISHNVLYPSSIFPFLDHNESTQAADDSMLNSSLKKGSKTLPSTPIFLQKSNSKSAVSSSNPFFELGERTLTADESLMNSSSVNNLEGFASTPLFCQRSSYKKDADSSDKGSLISSSSNTAVSAAELLQTSSTQLNPHKNGLPVRNKRKSSPMKALIVNDIFPTSSQKLNQNNDLHATKKVEEITSTQVNIVSANNLNSVEPSQLPPQLNESKESESTDEEGLIKSPVKTFKRNKRKLSLNNEIEQPSKKQILGDTNLSKSSQNPSVGNLPSKNTKPKSIRLRKIEPTPNIPTGISSNHETEQSSNKLSLGNREFSYKFLHNSPEPSTVSSNTESIHQIKNEQCLKNPTGISFSPETDQFRKTQSLGHTKSTNRISQNSPVRSIAYSSTKPKFVPQRKSELNPKIPAGVKIPSGWNTSKISSYSTAIENHASKEKSRKEYASKNSPRPRESTRRSRFPSPNKVPRTSSKAKRLPPSLSNVHERIRVSHSPRNFDRVHPYRFNRFEHSKPSYRNSPQKYFRPVTTIYNSRKRNMLPENVIHREHGNFSKETASKSDCSKASRSSKEELNKLKKSKEKSPVSVTHKDESENIVSEDTSIKNNNEKTGCLSEDCELRNIVDIHKDISQCVKSDCQVVTEKSDTSVTSCNIHDNLAKNENLHTSIPQNRETDKVCLKSNTSIVSVEMQSKHPETGDNIAEHVHEIHRHEEEPGDTESRTSADQNELNEAVAFLTYGNLVESRVESNVATSPARTTYKNINAVNESLPSSSDNIHKQDIGPVPGAAMSSKPGASSKEYIQYLVRKISERGGFGNLLQNIQKRNEP